MPPRGIGVVLANEIEAARLRRQIFDPCADKSAARPAECLRRAGFPRVYRDDVVALRGEPQRMSELIIPLGADEEHVVGEA